MTEIDRDWGFIDEDKGACKHVTTPTLKSIYERGGYVRKYGKSEVYIEGDVELLLYRYGKD